MCLGVSEWTAGEGTTFTVATNTAKEYRVRQTDSNNNTSSPSVGLLVTHDDLQPTITTFSVGDATLGADATTSINIVFSENMYGFIGSDVVMTGDGATSTFSGADGDSLYSLVYTSPNSGTGTVSFSLASDTKGGDGRLQVIVSYKQTNTWA